MTALGILFFMWLIYEYYGSDTARKCLQCGGRTGHSDDCPFK